MNYKIKKISEINIDHLRQFYALAFPSRYKTLSKHWKWCYKIGHSNFEPLVVEYNSKIIGMAGLISENLFFQGNIKEAIWFTDFHILKDYRNKGLGSILTKEWMKICPIQITYCNEESLKIFKKNNWKNNNMTYRNINPVNILKLIPILKKANFDLKSSIFKKYFIKKVKDSKSIEPKVIEYKSIIEYCKLEEESKNKNELFSILRDEKWFKWRLIDCPYSSEIYEFKDNQDILVAHVDTLGNLKRLNILYAYIQNKTNSDIFSLVFNWCLNNNIDFIWSINSNHNKIFNETFIGNLFLKKSLNFACWAKDNNVFTHLEKGLSNSQGFDSDLESNLYQDE